MNIKPRTKVIIELGITDEVALLLQVMQNSNIKKIEIVEVGILRVEYNDMTSWTLTFDELKSVQEKRNVKFE